MSSGSSFDLWISEYLTLLELWILSLHGKVDMTPLGVINHSTISDR